VKFPSWDTTFPPLAFAPWKTESTPSRISPFLRGSAIFGTYKFYRRHLPQAAAYLAPLNAFLSGPETRSSQPVPWTDDAKKAFNESKEKLCQATLLAHPVSSAQLALFTDASDFAIGASEQQLLDGSWQP